jgi:heme a synthase
MQRLRTLALVTTFATFLLISVGAFVRASGSGLGCPDWPRCFGRWIPPTAHDQVDDSYLAAHRFDRAQLNLTKTWIEYVNRLVGVVIGLLIVWTCVVAWRRARAHPRILAAVSAALLLVAFQGWQGGQIVKKSLDPRLVTVHLVLALVIVMLLVFAAVEIDRLGAERIGKSARPLPRIAGGLALGALVVALLQVTLGALVRGSIDLVARQEPALERGALLEHVGLVDHAHRITAIVVTILVLALGWTLRGFGAADPWTRRALVVAAACVGLQIAAGIALVYFALPPVAQVIHISAGAWLVGALFVVLLRVREARAATAA